MTPGTVSARGAAPAEPPPPAAATAGTESATGALRVSSRFRLRGALAVFKPRARTPWGRRRTLTGGGR